MKLDDCEHYFGIIDQVYPDKEVYPWPIGRKVSSTILHKYFVEKREIKDLDKLIQKYTLILAQRLNFVALRIQMKYYLSQCSIPSLDWSIMGQKIDSFND